MIPYLLLFAIFALGSLENKSGSAAVHYSRPLLRAAALLIILLIGFRYEVGADWFGYVDIFDATRYLPLATVVSSGDIGFYFLVWVVHQAGFEVWAVNLICAIVFTIGLVRFAERQPNPWLAISVAIPVLVILVALSATRQATAIGFMLLALTAFSDARMVRFLLFTCLAATFHASAIVILPVAALSYTRNRFQSVVTILIGGWIASYLLTSQLDDYVNRYTGEDPGAQGAIFRLAMNFVPACIYLLFPQKYGAAHHERVLWRNLSLLAIISLPMLAVVSSSTALDRASLYMIPLQLFVMSRLPYALSVNQRQRALMIIGVAVYSCIVMTVFFLLGSHAQYWLPYKVYPLFDNWGAGLF